MNAAANESAATGAEVLLARESRARRQQAWYALHAMPLVSITLVSPGPVKDSVQWRRVMRAALHAVDATLAAHNWEIAAHASHWLRSGPQALYAVRTDAVALKLAMIALEDTAPLGRLWDLDVIDANGPLSRGAVKQEPRRCLVCHERAHVCARARTHSLPLLLAAIDELTNEAE